ncbi:YqaJ viral recombinase family protein [Streptomyces sp. Root369]|uniref:YqaJ viral recombinase family nuclease n=1 Tax=Streptomyces sp. Root369 TaxID=1736523 RepID=UPI000AB0EF86|nr:YqaJ viral recombinase family protein [Streptomyces sp. Root369]
MTIAPALLFDLADLPPMGLPYAPTARLILPAGDLDDPEFRALWEAERHRGIGGSDVAAILGMAKRGPRRVYEEKHGFKQPDNRFMRFGRRMEPVVAAEFEDETGLKTAMPPGTLAHIEHGWARSNIDRFVLDSFGRVVAPLECKTHSEHVARQWDTEEEPPEAAALQAHWNTAIGGWDHSYVAAVVGGNRLLVWRQERDEELIEELFRFCGAWYQRHIVEGFPPPIDGSKDTEKLLAMLWEVKAESVEEIDLETADRLLGEHERLKAKVEAAEDELRKVKNEMRDIAGPSEIVKDPNGRVVWTNKQNGTLASKRLSEAHPDVVDRYTVMAPALDTKRLKAEQGDLYRKFQARQLLAKPANSTKKGA